MYLQTEEEGGISHCSINTAILCGSHVEYMYLHLSAQYVQSLESRLKEAAIKNSALMKENQLLREKLSQILDEVCSSHECP